MASRITHSLAVPGLLLGLGGPATAATVRGTVQFPDEVKGGALQKGAFWRVPNGVLPIAPALHDVRAEAVVVLFPSSPTASPEPDVRRRAARAEVRVAGLRVSPPVTVVPSGVPVMLLNEDRVTHRLVCSEAQAALPPQGIPAGSRVTLTLDKPGEYLLRSDDYAHLLGAILVVEHAYFGRVEPSGAFQLDAPEGHYQARLFWRGAWVASEPLDVAAQGTELHLRAALPGVAKRRPAATRPEKPG